jgi:hypothetical protein
VAGHLTNRTVLFHFRHEPAERLNYAVRLDSQGHLPAGAVELAAGSGASDRAGKHVVPREAGLAAAKQSAGVRFGEFTRIIGAAFTLVGLGKHQSQWAPLAAAEATTARLLFAQVA